MSGTTNRLSHYLSTLRKWSSVCLEARKALKEKKLSKHFNICSQGWHEVTPPAQLLYLCCSGHNYDPPSPRWCLRVGAERPGGGQGCAAQRSDRCLALSLLRESSALSCRRVRAKQASSGVCVCTRRQRKHRFRVETRGLCSWVPSPKPKPLKCKTPDLL